MDLELTNRPALIADFYAPKTSTLDWVITACDLMNIRLDADTTECIAAGVWEVTASESFDDDELVDFIIDQIREAVEAAGL